MKAAGLDQMFIQWTADSKNQTTIYPSALPGYTQDTHHDVVERALHAADESGAKIYLGLQINNDWWTKYLDDRDWLKNEARIANLLADDLTRRYRHHPSLAGWYLGFEVDNIETTSAQWDNLILFYRTVGQHLHKLTPGKPIIISPFFESRFGLSAAQWQTMWEYVLKRSPIDIMALQDGVGAGHVTRVQLPVWFEATRNAIHNSRPRMALWADTETFKHGFVTMGIHSIVDDMCAVQPYVSDYLSFSFNHYLSPQQANPLYYQTYMEYRATGKVESVSPTQPLNVSGVAVDSVTVQLTWTASTDNLGVIGYRILRDGTRATTTYNDEASYEDNGLTPGTTYSYQIEALDAAGNASVASDPVTVTTPPPHLYPINLALGKQYTSTMPADASYPDSVGVELTDGILDSSNFADPAWQGRATTKTYSFTIDLGAAQDIKEIRSDWLQDEASGILLPKQVHCSVSIDNVIFKTVGTVKTPMLNHDAQASWYTLTDLTGVNGRYVQVQVVPGAGAGWTFIDEIEVRQ